MQTEAPHDPAFVREWIKNDLERTQVWRSDKADDARNEKAASLLETLLETVPSIQPATIERLDRTFQANPDIESEWSLHLRFVGFHSFPNSAEDFVREFLEKLLVKVERPALRSVDDDGPRGSEGQP